MKIWGVNKRKKGRKKSSMQRKKNSTIHALKEGDQILKGKGNIRVTVRINIASFIDEWKPNNDFIKRPEQRVRARKKVLTGGVGKKKSKDITVGNKLRVNVRDRQTVKGRRQAGTFRKRM